MCPESLGECPRCGTGLRDPYRFKEPTCPTCGYVDYSGPVVEKSWKPDVWAGNRFIIRYSGPADACKELTGRVTAVPGPGAAKIAHSVECPFCQSNMRCFAPDKARYICPSNHVITLTPSLTWV